MFDFRYGVLMSFVLRVIQIDFYPVIHFLFNSHIIIAVVVFLRFLAPNFVLVALVLGLMMQTISMNGSSTIM